MKKVTKKEVAKVLRTMDSTQIFHLHFKMFGHSEKHHVYNFIRDNAPSVKVFKKAYEIAYPNKHQNERLRYESAILKKHGLPCVSKARIVEFLKEQITDVKSPYSKRPMYGFTNLYFCSPIYKHSDYNKHRTIPIKGNERFCEVLIKYADKFFAPVYD